jgi:hypothetical protein
MKRMKTKLFLLIFTIVFVSISFAQTKSDVKLKNIGQAKISIAKGKLLSKIDLSNDVAGCAFLTKKQKVQIDKDPMTEGCSAPDASFKLIDTTEKNKTTYLIVLSEAMGSCNVCGHDGAGNTFSIIWLKLDSGLILIKKKSVIVEWSLDDIAVINPKSKPNSNLSIWKPIFVKDLMIVEFEKTNYKDNGDVINYDFSHLEYNRKTPEKGFVVKTSKRKKSTIK